MSQLVDPNVVSTLQMEYNAIRQEIRDLLNSMDTNFKTGVSMIGGAIALASLSRDERLLFLIPSLMFMSASVHLLKTASANVHGAYCQVIETRLKSLLGKDAVLLDWEGGRLFKYISSPTGIVQVGFYLFFVAAAVLFCAMAVRAYMWQKWTFWVHAAEFLSLLGYAGLCVRWNTIGRRDRILSQYETS
ncbi:MAG: hypothetical protein HY294_06410 [Candidatus Rokubacteria bacterium]|nr:hypothetical protein [Candidatus Rokubacteria bacterium]